MISKQNKYWKKSRRLSSLVFLCTLLAITCPYSALGEDEVPIDDVEVVLLEEALDMVEEADNCGIEYNGFIATVKSNENSNGINTEALEFTEDVCVAETPEDVFKDYNANDVYSIEPNYTVTATGNTFSYVPNDTYYEDYQLYQMDLMNIPAVWSAGYEGRKSNGESVIVAVVDTGLIVGHEDINAKNIVNQRNVVTDDNDVTDVFGHGSTVAGIVGARKNNKTGITGVMPECSIMPVSFWDPSIGDGYIGEVGGAISAINYAVKNGADVINMSFKVDVDVSALDNACNNAVANGVILIAAAGNDGTDILSYPASYDCVVGVGSIGEDGVGTDISYFSQRGIENIFCVAPGTEVYSISNEGENLYSLSSGTSVAAPFVTSLAVMAKSINPSITCEQFMECIKKTSTDLGKKGRDELYGYGLVNFKKLAENLTGKKISFKYNHVEEIAIAHSKIQMTIGDIKKIKAKILPEDSVIKKVEWNSSDHAVVTFDYMSDELRAVGYGKATVTVTSLDTGVKSDLIVQTRFRDVTDKTKSYYKPVYWAADNYLIYHQALRDTAGVSNKCDKLDLVRMLWLMSGEPRIKNVKQYPDIIYQTVDDEYKAALWAKKNSIVITKNFSPRTKVTRKILALILYRAAGRPAVNGRLSFNDVNYSSKSESYKAILWCEQNKIMNGYSDGSFKPSNKCNYSTVYICLYRARNYIK